MCTFYRISFRRIFCAARRENYTTVRTNMSLYSLTTKRLSFAEGLEVEGVGGGTKEGFTLHS